MKASVIVLVALAATTLMRKRSAAVRHWVLSAAIVCAAATPLLELVVPSWHLALGATAPVRERDAAVPRAAASSQTAAPVSLAAVSPEPPRPNRDALSYAVAMPSLTNLLTAAWIAGVSISIGLLLVGLGRLAWLASRSRRLVTGPWIETAEEISRRYGIARPVWLLQSDHPSLLVTWGLLRPRIILPRAACAWPADRIRIVLSHELAHIQRGDWLVQMTAELLRSVYWFNPLMWIAARILREESERACDDAVLNSGIQPAEYAREILDLARTLENPFRGWSAALAFARTTHLERRFMAMLNPSIDRHCVSRRTRLLTSLIALCLLLPLAAIRLPAQSAAGKFGGTIHDPSGAAVSNATVIVANQKTNTISMTSSGAEGNFVLKALPAGEYELKVVKQGFEVYRMPRIALEPGRDMSQSISLQVAADKGGTEGVAQSEVNGQSETGTDGKTTRLRIEGSVQASGLVEKVMPVYPQSGRSAGIQGSVNLNAVIGIDGRPMLLRVMNPEIDPELARAAIEAVSKWRYRPVLVNGKSVEVETTVMVNFSLAP